MWVVKLGGSLLGTPDLKAWLDVLARRSDGRIVIVPGGGVYADSVRDAQKIAGFDDGMAHHLALLAMEQYGLTLKALKPSLVTASSELEISERSWQHRAIVWLPSKMVLADDDIPQNWDVTSDSLAAWLAQKINASRLVIVKHGEVPAGRSLEELMADGTLDSAFPMFSKELSCKIDVVGKADHGVFAQTLTTSPQPSRAF